MKGIRKYYVEKFPTDELGLDINPFATFEGLLNCLQSKVKEDVYKYIDVSDSLIRERCFEGLAEILGCEYNLIYDLWMSSENYRF